MRLPILLQVLLIAFLHNDLHIAVEGALSAVVESGEEHCYNVIAPAGVKSTIHGNFDILDDNESPDPIGVVLYDSKMVSQNEMSPVMSIMTIYISSCASRFNSILNLPFLDRHRYGDPNVKPKREHSQSLVKENMNCAFKMEAWDPMIMLPKRTESIER